MPVMQPLITPLTWYNFQRKSSVTETEVTTTYLSFRLAETKRPQHLIQIFIVQFLVLLAMLKNSQREKIDLFAGKL